MKPLFGRALGFWIPLAVGLTGIFAFSYLAVQQNYRQSLNDPQIQMGEDAARLLAQTNAPASVVPRGQAPIDIAVSLAPWIAVYDSHGTPLESNAVLEGAPPKPPAGLFDDATWLSAKTYDTAAGKETRVTWQPNPDVRQALVLVRVDTKNGVQYVGTGRNMREVESRVAALTGHVLFLWGGTELATLIATLVLLALGWL